ncbi:periaxin isoform X1 [Pelobates cultripes]|uniref:Periaxin isoform X1 n=1 Tax=Pelobates cultripes TaxID=61616 RepID=A0AAD1SZZ5_PELCU|nr:periaxin isoform X1 [Pelobates cultripes]
METHINITEVVAEKLKASEMVEVIVETEPQSGMSGISISGGGKEGLFISDLLKDSPAAKTLPLLEGDQILSARVFFENVKYEDALRILQCAEQYKVSFCLKRTVPSADVTVSPTSGSVEVKGPKAKMPKMTVKSLTPVKKKKKKVPSQVKVSEEGSMEALKGSEISVGSMEIPPVDVEFSFPKFSKLLKTKSVTETSTVTKTTEVTTKASNGEQKWAKMKFPRLRVKEAAAGAVSVEVPEIKTSLPKGSPVTEEKDKADSKFGISVPKIKKPKVEATVSKPEVELSVPKLEIETKTPQVELDIPLPTMKTDTQEISTTESIKMAMMNASAKIPDVEIKVPSSHIEVEAPDIKISTPHVSTVGICTSVCDKKSDITVEGKPKTEITFPTVEIAPPKLDMDLSLAKPEGVVVDEPTGGAVKGFQIKLPTFGKSAKTSTAEMEVSPPKIKKDIEVKAFEDRFKMPSIKTPEIGISFPTGKLEGDSPDGKQKLSMKMPSLDVSAPKVDISLAKANLDLDISGETEIPDVTLKMPKASPPKIGMKVKDAYADSMKIKGDIPQVDLKHDQIEAELSVGIPDVTFKLPKVGLSIPGEKIEMHDEVTTGKLESEGQDFKLRGPKIKLPSFVLSPSKDKPDIPHPELDISDKESKLQSEGKVAFSSIKVPSLAISLPKVPDIQPGKLEVTLPTTKADIKAPDLEGASKYDLKLKMPKVSLPQLEVSTKVEKPQVSPPKIGIHMPKIESKVKEGDLTEKGDKFTLPKLDISVPKIKPAEVDITPSKADFDISVEKPKIGLKAPKVGSDAIAFDGEIGDSKLGFPSVKIPSLEIDTPKFDIDLNLQKVKLEGSDVLIEQPDSNVQMPKITFPKLTDVTKDMSVEINVPKITSDISLPRASTEMKRPEFGGVDHVDRGAKISLPKIEIGLGKPSDEETSDIKLPKVKLEGPDVEGIEAKLKLPSMKMPSVAITAPKVPDVDIDASLPKVGIEGLSKEEVTGELATDSEIKFKASKFSLRKLGISGPKFKKGGEADIKTSPQDGEREISVKSPKMKMPKFGITFPKSKQDADVAISKPALEMDTKTKKAKAAVSVGQIDAHSEGKVKLPSVTLPTVDISAPKLEVDIAIPKGETSHTEHKPSDISIDIPEVKLNLPKFSMPKFGSKSKGSDVDVEMESTKLHGKVATAKLSGGTDTSSDGGSSNGKGKGKMKMPAIKMPSFGISKKEADVSDIKLDVSPPEVKLKKAKEAVKETKVEVDSKESDGKTSFIKMPTFKMSPPKVKTPDSEIAVKGSKEDLHLPDIQVKVPQVELPSFGIKSEKSADVTLPKAEAKLSGGIRGLDIGEKIRIPSLGNSTLQEVPSLQISVPCIKPEPCISSPKAEVDVSDADIKAYEGDLKIPKLPSVSVPSLELDIGLAKPTSEVEFALEKSDMKLKMPKVELPNFGEYGRTVDAKVDTEVSKYKTGEAEAKLKGSKIKMPHFDISLSRGKSDEEGIPFIEGELKMHGTDLETSTSEGKFSMPSVELPKISTPKIRAPELDLEVSLSKDGSKTGDHAKTHGADVALPDVGLPDLKLKMPKIKLPKFGGSNSGVDEETTKLDVKAVKTEETEDSGKMGFKIKMPKLYVGPLKGRDDGSVEMEGDHKKTVNDVAKTSDHEDSENSRRFKIKMPSFGISKEGTGAATEFLHPTEEGGELKFKMPKVSIPDVGFSGSETEGDISLESGQAKALSADSKVKAPKSSSLENLEIDVGLKMPKIKMPTIGMPGWKSDDDMNVSLEEDLEGRKSAFKMPDVEISTPKIKAHAEYNVDGAKLEDSWSKEMETELISTKTSKAKEESKDHGTTEEESGKKYKVKLPKFGISLPKPIPGDVELTTPKIKSSVKQAEINIKTPSSDHESDQHEGKKSRRNIFSLGKNKERNAALLTSDADITLEGEGPELKIKMPKIKMKPSFGRGKTKGAEVNGELDASASGETDAELSPEGKSSKIKFPKLGFSSSKGNAGDVNVNGTSSSGRPNDDQEVNGSQDSVAKMGKLKMPKLEISTPHKGKESDLEMNLKLVKGEDQDYKEESHESSFTSKFKSFSGFKKKEKGEEHLSSSPAKTDVETKGEGDGKSGRSKISLGFLSSKSKGEYTVDNSGIEKDTEGESSKEKKYKIPKLSLSPKPETEISTQTSEITQEGYQEGFTIGMPKVGFTTHHEEHTVEEKVAGGFLKITTTKQIKTETVTEKTLSI